MSRSSPRVVSADEILVDHANWRHGTVSRGIVGHRHLIQSPD
jgi:hypothetical protein